MAGYTADPIAEATFLATPGLVHEYRGRALLVAGGCAVNCRYCFSCEFPYSASGATRRGIDQALAAVADNDSLTEVILSGRDPLLVDDDELTTIIERLEAIPHVRRLAGLPAVVLNQSVLLRGVNDSPAVLASLCERLVEIGVVPYWLHLLDRVRGAAQFEVSEAEARQRHLVLRETLPGHAVPRLVLEIPGERSKKGLA